MVGVEGGLAWTPCCLFVLRSPRFPSKCFCVMRLYFLKDLLSTCTVFRYRETVTLRPGHLMSCWEHCVSCTALPEGSARASEVVGNTLDGLATCKLFKLEPQACTTVPLLRRAHRPTLKTLQARSRGCYRELCWSGFQVYSLQNGLSGCGVPNTLF